MKETVKYLTSVKVKSFEFVSYRTTSYITILQELPEEIRTILHTSLHDPGPG